MCGLIHLFVLVICQTEAFAVCESYSPPEGFKEEDLYHLLEKVGISSGADDLRKATPNGGFIKVSCTLNRVSCHHFR